MAWLIGWHLIRWVHGVPLFLFLFEERVVSNAFAAWYGEWFMDVGVMRDFLFIFASSQMCLDVWIMKEYGNESYVILFVVPYIENRGLYAYTKALYISEDDQLLIDFNELGSVNLKLVVYNSKNDTLNILDIRNNNQCIDLKFTLRGWYHVVLNVKIYKCKSEHGIQMQHIYRWLFFSVNFMHVLITCNLLDHW